MEAVSDLPVESVASKGRFKLKPRFVKGVSGNPAGKAKGVTNFNTRVRGWLEEMEGDKPRLEKALKNLLRWKPDVLLHYAYGKPAETLIHQNPDGTALRSTVIMALSQAVIRGEVQIPQLNQNSTLVNVEPVKAIPETVNDSSSMSTGVK